LAAEKQNLKFSVKL